MNKVVSKIVSALVTVLIVSFLVYGMQEIIPGDPAIAILGEEATPELIETVRSDLNLDDPFIVRYGRWLADAARGDLGVSYRTNIPISDAIISRLPVSAQLMVAAQFLALLFAIPGGIITAYRSGSRLDRVTTGGAFGFISVPEFVLGLVAIFVFALGLGWLPATGWASPLENPIQSLRSTILPAGTMALSILAIYQRLLRSDMIATLQEDYVMMARSKGLPTWHILFRHALRPSSFSLITLAGVNTGRLIGGSVIVETLFVIPGLGRLLVQSIFQRDFLMTQGVVLFIAVSYVLINTLVDLLYTVLDPRVRERATA